MTFLAGMATGAVLATMAVAVIWHAAARAYDADQAGRAKRLRRYENEHGDCAEIHEW